MKKTPVKGLSGVPLLPGGYSTEYVVELAAKNLKLEQELMDVKLEFTKAVKDFEAKEINKDFTTKSEPDVHQELLNCQARVDNLNDKIADLVNENKEYKKKVENLKVEVKDLEVSNKTRKEVADQLNKKLSDSKIKSDQEMAKIIKTHKAEVKYWRKKLGEETKIKMKLIEKLEYVEESDTKESIVTTHKKTMGENLKSSLKENIFCSICSLSIQNYIPEYFCGEKYNPACQNCKEKDSSWTLEDPFSSFPSPFQPISLVSHWLLPTADPIQSPGLIISLQTHCVKLPNPGDRFISVEEALEMMQILFQKQSEWIKSFKWIE